MIFNLDLSKQAQEVIFSRKTNKISHPTTTFNTVPVACTSCQKHLRLYLDEKLHFRQPNNESFCTKIERIQCNAILAITGAIRGTSQIKLYKELGLESLKFRRWFRRLCIFFKI